MEAMQSTLLPAAGEAFPDTYLTSCDLHCSWATTAWRAMLIMLHGVTGGPTMSRSLEICIQYSTTVKTTGGHPLIVDR